MVPKGTIMALTEYLNAATFSHHLLAAKNGLVLIVIDSVLKMLHK
jgi:hypothetical protein